MEDKDMYINRADEAKKAELAAVHTTLSYLERQLSATVLGLDPSSDIARADGGWRHVPLSAKSFARWVLLAKELVYEVKRWENGPNWAPTMDYRFHFLDVGSGLGTKVLMGSHILGCGYWTAHGIEFRPKYVDFCKNHGISHVELADGREYTGYDKFDIIYFYNPMCNKNMEEVLETAIYRGAKEDCIFINDGYFMQEMAHKLNDWGCWPLSIKTTNTALVEKLRGVVKEFIGNYATNGGYY